MNYYIDTEFLEGTQKEKFPISLFRKNTPPTIDLISIGIVSEDNREYCAISKDFNLKEAWNRFDRAKQTMFEKQNGFEGRKIYWIRENVLKPIWIDLFLLYEAEFTFLKGEAYDQFEKELKKGKHDAYFTFKSIQALIKRYGKHNYQIAEEIQSFTKEIPRKPNEIRDNTKFYAYFADYDWVAFCWLFGKMMDLPNGFPMYCNDLKQLMDENSRKDSHGTFHGEGIKNHPNYPKQENEHSAIFDARWNKKLHEFLNQF